MLSNENPKPEGISEGLDRVTKISSAMVATAQPGDKTNEHKHKHNTTTTTTIDGDGTTTMYLATSPRPARLRNTVPQHITAPRSRFYRTNDDGARVTSHRVSARPCSRGLSGTLGLFVHSFADGRSRHTTINGGSGGDYNDDDDDQHMIRTADRVD